MGCFGAMCAISGLPIEAGDPVRFLTKSPFEDGVPVGMNHFWCPRTYPLKGVYNNYGGVAKVEDEKHKQAWLDALAYDVIPRGVGDNTVHDVSVAKKMTWDDLQVALRERRILVRSHVDDIAWAERDLREDKDLLEALALLGKSLPKPNPKPKKVLPEGIPTRVRVEKILRVAGFQISESGQKLFTGPGGFLVNTRRFGEVRVRFESWSRENFGKDESFLQKALPALAETYAVLLSAGYGNYSHGPEILVRVKPGTKDWSGGRQGEKNKGLEVTQVMIREDVWQALLQVPCGKTSVVYAYTLIDKYGRGGGADVPDFKLHDGLPYVLGTSSHWYLMGKEGPYPREFLLAAAEFKHVIGLLSYLGYYWRATIDGHQETFWGKHFEVLEALTGIAYKKANKRRK